jgi:hypothetical protein
LRRILLILLVCSAAWGQAPKIGSIDFYGRRKASEESLRKALGVKAGDPLPASKGDVEDELVKVTPVVEAQLQAVCCDEKDDAILYVGIEEKGAPHFDYRLPPTGEARLPEEIIDEYNAFVISVERAGRSGKIAEDWTAGHSMFANLDVREHQQRFLDLASKHLLTIRQVLRSSADDFHRQAAACLIGYAPKDKIAIVRDVIADLQFALRDPDDTVRGTAIRSLGALSVMASLNPESRITISPTWFIEMLDSLIWNDKMAAVRALVTLSDDREKTLLARLAEKSTALAEMASWKHLPHALPAFVLLGRSRGESEQTIQAAWSSPDPLASVKRWQSRR